MVKMWEWHCTLLRSHLLFICFIFHLGTKLPIQNEISKLPVPSFNPDLDEKPHNNISEASTSSIETISTVLIKEHEETFTKTKESIYEKPFEVNDLKPVTDIGEEKSSNNNGMNYTFHFSNFESTLFYQLKGIQDKNCAAYL